MQKNIHTARPKLSGLSSADPASRARQRKTVPGPARPKPAETDSCMVLGFRRRCSAPRAASRKASETFSWAQLLGSCPQLFLYRVQKAKLGTGRRVPQSGETFSWGRVFCSGGTNSLAELFFYRVQPAKPSAGWFAAAGPAPWQLPPAVWVQTATLGTELGGVSLWQDQLLNWVVFRCGETFSRRVFRCGGFRCLAELFFYRAQAAKPSAGWCFAVAGQTL